MEWQTINTAPKDGTPILAWDGRNYVTVYWDAYVYLYRTDSGAWQLVESGWGALDADISPTHWMPLPAPPKD